LQELQAGKAQKGQSLTGDYIGKIQYAQRSAGDVTHRHAKQKAEHSQIAFGPNVQDNHRRQRNGENREVLGRHPSVRGAAQAVAYAEHRKGEADDGDDKTRYLGREQKADPP
jgi:hypothetical protein